MTYWHAMSLNDAMTPDEAVGELVHRVMWRQHKSARQLAPALGISGRTLSRKIRGQVTWTVEDLMNTAAVLGVDPKALVPEVAAQDEDPAAFGAPATGLEPVTCRAFTLLAA